MSSPGDIRDAHGRRSASAAGLALAAVTASVSGISVFVNSYGVHAITPPALYTTAKNLVAFVVLAAASLCARRVPGLRLWNARSARGGVVHAGLRTWIGLVYVGVVGGGVAFVFFFDGLARTAAVPAAFWHDSLVVWVALLALPLLRESLRWWNTAAIAVLVLGEVALHAGVGHLDAGPGQMLVLGATLMWSVEVVVAKWLLRGVSAATLSMVRMGVGAAALLVYSGVTGQLHMLTSLGAGQLSWAGLTGLLLAAYVGTWMGALRLARAVDVSSVLVASVFVTALLQDAAGTARIAPQVLGLALVAVGSGVVVLMGTRTSRPATAKDRRR